jgi:nitroimidazol reductase NimA-like FMN-containing flavoprotein (pyridoxamine 5'-phosphate oxidase superfamily)
MEALHPPDRLEPLDTEECLSLLSAGEVGRLGFVADGQPRIEPVNFRLVDGTVVIVSRAGAKLDAAVHRQLVAFELDAVEQWAHAGWSVLVLGSAHVVVDPAECARLLASGPEPWTPISELSVIRIEVAEVTGRRVRVDPGGVSVLTQEPEVPRPAW